MLPVYILDEHNSGQWCMGGASRWWLHQSLTALNHSLEGKLLVLRGDPSSLIPALVQDSGACAVHWNRCYEPWRVIRDKVLKEKLRNQAIEVRSFNASLLWEPWQVNKADGTPYKVFTPFYRKGCLQAASPSQPVAAPQTLHLSELPGTDFEQDIARLELMPDIDWYKSLEQCWHIGETAAQERLQEFLDQGLAGYRKGRDFPADKNVSRLSPHLHFGELSPREVWHQAQAAGIAAGDEKDLEHFLSELGWREFSHYLLYHNPDLPEKNYQQKFDAFPWQDKPEHLRAWQKGLTGYPLVDAGMRELWQTGYMHNRVRMVVASFLIKNLMQDWRHGQAWFWDTLVDADLANNSASWQWVAGCGADAAPYFRIFNPVTQSQRFDPEGDYIRRFVPELAGLPDKHLHDPGSAPADVLARAGVRLNKDYPRAIVDLRSTREAALQAFKALA